VPVLMLTVRLMLMWCRSNPTLLISYDELNIEDAIASGGNGRVFKGEMGDDDDNRVTAVR
jgi:hypothetical protein